MASTNTVMTQTPPLTINATPRAGQDITHDGNHFTTIKEGLAHILVPHGVPTSTDPKLSKEDTQKQQVFYNPIQQFNRDLSVLAIKTFGQDLVQRRIQRHEQHKKKDERRKQRKREKLTAQENGDEIKVENESVAPDTMEDGVSRKRKLEDAAELEDVATKRPRVGDDGVTEAGEGFANGSNQHSSPWKPAFSILDALSATGLRALRYAHEIPFATSITANDMSAKAVESIALNVKHNKLEEKIRANTGNAIAYMYSYCDKKGYDVIDLDPYGTAAPFLDSAIQAINDEGMLCVTCTDSAIFASHGYLEKTYSQYGGLPFKGDPCHEGGLRLLLNAISTSAARYGMSVEPLLSLSIDYYIRVFVRIRKAPNDVKLLAGKTMLVYHCQNGCGSWSTQFLARNKAIKNKNDEAFYKFGFAAGPSADEHCRHCGSKTHLTGPMYGGPLHNVGFIERVLAHLNEASRETYPTMDRIEGMLHTAMEEITFGAQQPKEKAKESQALDPLIPKADPAEIDHHPFFFLPSSIAKVIHCSAPPAAAMRGALRHAGFRVAMSHCKPGSIKTDASWTDIWHILLEWARQRAPMKNPLRKESPGYAIVSKASATGHFKADVNQPVSDDTLQPNGETPGKDPAQKPSYMGTDFEVNLDEKLGKDADRGKYVRYQLAPRENWGPMSRAK